MTVNLQKITSNLYKWWMAFAHFLAMVNTTIILTVVYLLLIGPVWLVMKLRRKDLLDRNPDSAATFWRQKEPVQPTLEQSKRQF